MNVLIVPCVEWYENLLNLLKQPNGETTLAQRRKFAAKAFEVSSHYDSAIFNWFNVAEGILRSKSAKAQTKPSVMAKIRTKKAFSSAILKALSAS